MKPLPMAAITFKRNIELKGYDFSIMWKLLLVCGLWQAKTKNYPFTVSSTIFHSRKKSFFWKKSLVVCYVYFGAVFIKTTIWCFLSYFLLFRKLMKWSWINCVFYLLAKALRPAYSGRNNSLLRFEAKKCKINIQLMR